MKSYNGFTPAQRMEAYNWLKAQSDRAMHGACEVCGNVDAKPHSEDYSAPYGSHIGAYMLCFPCHMMVHCRFRAMGLWNGYRDMVRNGYRWDPPPKNWFAFRSSLWGGGCITWAEDQPVKKRTCLDDINIGVLRTRRP